MVSGRNHLFFNNDSPPPRQFLPEKILLKKKLGEMLIEQIIDLGQGPLTVHVLLSWLFSWQNKNLERKSLSELLFTGKILQEAMYLTSPY